MRRGFSSLRATFTPRGKSDITSLSVTPAEPRLSAATINKAPFCPNPELAPEVRSIGAGPRGSAFQSFSVIRGRFSSLRATARLMSLIATRLSPRGKRRRAIGVGWITAVAVTLALGPTEQTVAQERGRVAVADSALDSLARRIESMSPRSGPPGTIVTLRSTNMPAITPVRIGVGALRFGFEEVAQVMTSNQGVLSTTVDVPEWAQRDLIHRFIVFDFYFNPIALSDIFHVTDADGLVLRRGQLTAEGVECPTLRGDDGVLYTLTGDLAEFKAGDEVIVEGTLPEMSICMQGTTIQVVRIEEGSTQNP